MKKLFLIVLIICVALFFFFANYSIAFIKGDLFLLEVARTPAQRAKGLSRRDHLCSRCGMIFVMPTTDRHEFWMKDMEFDLDFLWLKDRTVVEVSNNISYNLGLAILAPKNPVNFVLELPAGTVDRVNLAEGDKITLLLF